MRKRKREETETATEITGENPEVKDLESARVLSLKRLTEMLYAETRSAFDRFEIVIPERALRIITSGYLEYRVHPIKHLQALVDNTENPEFDTQFHTLAHEIVFGSLSVDTFPWRFFYFPEKTSVFCRVFHNLLKAKPTLTPTPTESHVIEFDVLALNACQTNICLKGSPGKTQIFDNPLSVSQNVLADFSTGGLGPRFLALTAYGPLDHDTVETGYRLAYDENVNACDPSLPPSVRQLVQCLRVMRLCHVVFPDAAKELREFWQRPNWYPRAVETQYTQFRQTLQIRQSVWDQKEKDAQREDCTHSTSSYTEASCRSSLQRVREAIHLNVFQVMGDPRRYPQHVESFPESLMSIISDYAAPEIHPTEMFEQVVTQIQMGVKGLENKLSCWVEERVGLFQPSLSAMGMRCHLNETRTGDEKHIPGQGRWWTLEIPNEWSVDLTTVGLSFRFDMWKCPILILSPEDEDFSERHLFKTQIQICQKLANNIEFSFPFRGNIWTTTGRCLNEKEMVAVILFRFQRLYPLFFPPERNMNNFLSCSSLSFIKRNNEGSSGRTLL
jgi:hypothetical protein